MSLRPERHPDMNLNDVDYSITYQLCQNFDVDRSWEQLAGTIGYSTSHILTFELELRRAHGSPTKALLWDWGSRGGTVRELYGKLALINRTQSMRLLEHIMNKDKEGQKAKREAKKGGECLASPTSPSLESKDSNMLSPSLVRSTMSYNASVLPVPVMKRVPSEIGSEDFNLNTSSNIPGKDMDKKLKNVLIPEQGAASAVSMEMSQCQADGPSSSKGNMGAASSSVGSLNRVKSVIEEYGSNTECMSQLNQDEKEVARALMNTPHYTYKELSQATGGFSANNKLGQGKFGAVYLGMVKNTRCAIKKLLQKHDRRGEENSSAHMASELKALCRYRHENIVALYGYALDGDEVCLVYQYMPNKSLHDCLHCKAGQNLVLTWDQRLCILLGAARGLQFLHTVDQKPVIHGDIKSANILLDRHFEAKIGDLGLAQQATGGEVTGKLTHITRKTTSVQDYQNKAYYAPEIIRGSGFSIKGDTYAFGVVLFECLTGQEAFDERREGSSDDKYLINYINNLVSDSPKMNKTKTFEDPKMGKSFPETMFQQMFDLGEKCVKIKKKDRPTMVEVYTEIDKVEKVYNGPEYLNIQEMNLDKLPNKQPSSDASKPYSISEMAGESFDSNGSYSPGLKSANHPLSSEENHSAQNSPAPQPEIPASPIECLPKNQPIPEAFRLQLEMDQKREHIDTHKYENVTSKLEKQMKHIFVSDPKKLAEIEKADREFSAPLAVKKGESENPASDFAKVKAIEEFDRKNVGELKSGVNEPVESEYASDPRKLSMLEEQDKVLTKASASEYHVYENVPTHGSCVETGYNKDNFSKDEEAKGCSLDNEFADITGKAAKGGSKMMDLFKKFDDLKEDDQYQFGAVNEYEDEYFPKFDFEKDDSESSSTVTDSINNDFDSFHLSEINEDDLFDKESQVLCRRSPQQGQDESPTTEGRSPHTEGRSPPTEGRSPHTEGRSPPTEGRSPHTEGRSPHMDRRSPHMEGRSPHMERRSPHTEGRSPQQGQDESLTTEQSLEKHQRQLARYTEMTDHSVTRSGKQTTADTTVNQSNEHRTGSQLPQVNAGQKRRREPTENDNE